eukprot:Gregarina_sp_Pseudo_9__1011@NODE_1653_length_1426_cov_12_522711_g1533_i0_p1_GENE_NODE_1653_length_1426_cov_12_522711_g1533_i0NODE_1653_length_1426_cov_12_522711_g1533_i0_p1_ORF_typecomplete_len388_score45_65HOOK/PF05622_12/2_2e23MAD/PF05557_13/2_5e07CENPF_leu_zip/PF10473_9/0_0092CENPF_leu_zip/PF10473_9/5_8e05CENPF_leu_zip/PF10473_9/46DUF3584/PF12128_8/7_9e05Rab5bind/PF09311_11/6_9e05Rab5bind/PF09311_11/34Rab5bind/PF09311_11/1_3e03AAA_13/PF13166_6/0_00071AAA_13/PF13166_6/1e02Spc7/PF08317_11/1_5Sp
MEEKQPPTLNLESLRERAMSDSYEPSEPPSSSVRYDPLKEVAEDYERRLANVENEKLQLIAERDEALERARKDREALQKKEGEVEDLHQEVNVLEGKQEDLKKELKNASKMHDLEVKRLSDDLAEMTEYRERFTSVAKQLERYRSKIDEMGDQQDKIESLKQELDMKMKEILEMEKGQEELAEIKDQVEKLKATTAEQTANLIASQTEKAVVDQEVVELRQRVQHLEREKSSLHLQLSIQPDRSPGLGGSSEKSVNMSGGSENVRDLKAHILRLEKQVESLKQQNGETSSKTLAELQQQLELSERTKAILQSKLQEALVRSASLASDAARGDDVATGDNYQSMVAHEKAKQQTMHEFYYRVIHRCMLALLELTARCREHSQQLHKDA